MTSRANVAYSSDSLVTNCVSQLKYLRKLCIGRLWIAHQILKHPVFNHMPIPTCIDVDVHMYLPMLIKFIVYKTNIRHCVYDLIAVNCAGIFFSIFRSSSIKSFFNNIFFVVGWRAQRSNSFNFQSVQTTNTDLCNLRYYLLISANLIQRTFWSD
jgi:hypothetical protein